MSHQPEQGALYLEVGQKRTFAGAIEWPGWCRGGHDEAAALEAFAAYHSRYARVLEAATISVDLPVDPAAFAVVERLDGNAATDFGAANIAPSADTRPFDDATYRRSEQILQACWRAFDGAIEAATGKELSKGPRGGGRDLTKLVRHVLGADASYMGRLAQKFRSDEGADPTGELARTREAMLAGLAAGACGEIPARGPRGGKFWTPRYFVRRVAWHTLDHTWELEDRIG